MKRLLIVLFFFLAILVLVLFKPIFCESYYSGIIGSILAAFFAAFLVWVAWEELSNLSKTSSADFIHKLDNDFFTHETRKLVALIDCGALEFLDPTIGKNQSIDEIELIAYFVVRKDNFEQTNLPEEIIKSLCKKKYYSTWQIDDLLLGLCENIGMLEQRGIVNFQMVYDVFGYYLELIWEYDQIRNYIMYCRKEEKRENKIIDEKSIPVDKFFYNQFQYIALKCIEYNNLPGGRRQLLWKIKRYFRGPKIEWDLYNYKSE
jgi:hypothetical protein